MKGCSIYCHVLVSIPVFYVLHASRILWIIKNVSRQCQMSPGVSNSPTIGNHRSKNSLILYLHLNFKCIRSSRNRATVALLILCYLWRHFLLRNAKLFSLFTVFITMTPNYCSKVTLTTKISLLKPQWMSLSLKLVYNESKLACFSDIHILSVSSNGSIKEEERIVHLSMLGQT